MVSLGDNGAISMDVSFDTNDVKFHLFTLIMFDPHHTGVPVAWIITSHQTCDDLMEWLTLLKTKWWWCFTKIMNIAVSFIFILPFLSFYIHVAISKFHPTFSIVNNIISWNDNKLIFYAWLGLCGMTIKCPFTFTCGMS